MNTPCPDPRDSLAIQQALTNLHKAERRKPTEADRPPPSTFASTPASRAAMRMARQADRDRYR